jgi:hypothetical protein
MYVTFRSIAACRLIESIVERMLIDFFQTTARLPDGVTEERLEEALMRYGKITSVRLPPDSLHQRSHRGYGFVTFENAEDAREAVNKGITIGSALILILTT